MVAVERPGGNVGVLEEPARVEPIQVDPVHVGPAEQTAPAEHVTRQMRLMAAARDVVETVLLALVLFFGVRLGVQNFRVEGYSMEPTLHRDQYLLVDKLSYAVSRPQRGDIVVFRWPEDPSMYLVKRIVALPGEEVEVANGTVYVDGRAMDEPYIREEPHYDFAKSVVPPGEYFVLGDNRNNSLDSHVWSWLPKEDLVGRAWISYWPHQSLGMLGRGAYRFVTS